MNKVVIIGAALAAWYFYDKSQKPDTTPVSAANDLVAQASNFVTQSTQTPAPVQPAITPPVQSFIMRPAIDPVAPMKIAVQPISPIYTPVVSAPVLKVPIYNAPPTQYVASYTDHSGLPIGIKTSIAGLMGLN